MRQVADAVPMASLWATHCGPKWASWPMASVTRIDAQGWVTELCATHRARHRGRPAEGDDVPLLAADTVASIVHVMSALYRATMREHPPIVLTNPFAELDMPAIERRPVEFYEPGEAAALYEAAKHWPARDRARRSSWACRWACDRKRSTVCTATGWTGCAASWPWST
jgi:hypothetical protein